MAARRNKKRWSDLTPGQRAAIVGLGIVEVGLTAAALTDLYRRPKEQVRGPKAVWCLAAFVQPVGPVAYLVWGRRGGTTRLLTDEAG